jgi:2-polyprenyl-3-methyl-5-hydroxy-6-metoxy-1,4-benzoquinol methylase
MRSGSSPESDLTLPQLTIHSLVVMATDAKSSRVTSIFREVLEAHLPEYDPWFYQYCGELKNPSPVATFLRHLNDRLEFGGIQLEGKRVLDAGCGFGFTLVALAELGVAEAHGIEIYQPMVDTARGYMKLLPDEVRICIAQGDVSAMPYADNSFDLIVSFEAISHYRDVDGFIRDAYRVLRPGAALLISDGNNGLNPLKRRNTRQVWDAFELGPKGIRVHGHVVEHHYEKERRTYIEESFPDVPAERMAHETFGMTLSEVAATCERYRQDGSFPGSVYDRHTVPLNPNDGTVIERLFNPYALAARMRAVGFSTRTQGYWGGASGRKMLRIANAVLRRLSPVTIVTARAFWIAARKPK